jgi:ABC-type Mn2+/Zn2+ transport system ATPase subunit
MLQFKNISLSYNTKKIFENLSFKVEKETHVCLVGESGKGKTSVFNLIMSAVQAESGEIIVDQKILNEESFTEINKQICWVPQNFNFPVDSAIELIELLEIKRSRVEKSLDRLGVDIELFEKKFNEISGGQKQKLVLACCLALDKNILLLDEPSSALDKKSTEQVFNYLKTLKEKTILSISHDKNWYSLADKIIEL